MTLPIRILLLDQHTLFRELLRCALEPHPQYLVVGESGAEAEGLALAARLAPDVILLELNLDGELKVEVIPALLDAAPQAKLILLTGIGQQSILQLAVQMGAMGVISKTSSLAVACKAVEKVHAGEVWLDRTMLASVITQLTRVQPAGRKDPEAARIEQLSERELQVVRMIGLGLKNREIANRLMISEITVRHHLSSIYSKLQVADRLELTVYAYKNGLAAVPA